MGGFKNGRCEKVLLLWSFYASLFHMVILGAARALERQKRGSDKRAGVKKERERKKSGSGKREGAARALE